MSPANGEAGINSFTMPEPKADAARTMVLAHERARSILREKTAAKVGWTIAIQSLVARDGYEDKLAHYEQVWEDTYLEASRDDDWVGVQSYTSQLVGPDGLEGAPAGAELTQTGWAYRPDALEIALRRTWDVTGGIPMIVTENGIATADDARRIDYTAGALEGLARTLDDGLDVRGYLHWTFIDNFEWVHGYAITFGLVAVDRTTYERTPKPSADVARARSRERTEPRLGTTRSNRVRSGSTPPATASRRTAARSSTKTASSTGTAKTRRHTTPGSGNWHWGVRAYSSTDLYNWEDRGLIIPPVLDDPESPLHPAQKMDRPHIIFNETTGKYVCWIKVMGEGSHDTQRSTVLTADSLLGPYEIVRTGLRTARDERRRLRPGRRPRHEEGVLLLRKGAHRPHLSPT